MNLQLLLEHWHKESSFSSLFETVMGYGSHGAVTGLDGSARVYFQAGLAHHSSRPALIVSSDAPKAERIYEDLLSFMPQNQVYLLPQREIFIESEVLSRSTEQREQRLAFYQLLLQQRQGIIVAPVAALLNRVLPPQIWNRYALKLREKLRLDREELLMSLIVAGYERTALIEGKGQFSARGEIIDIYPFGWEFPLRIALFDDEIESLRYFDLSTQRSIRRVEEANIFPAYEYLLPPEIFAAGEKGLRQELSRVVGRLVQKGEADAAARLRTRAEQHINQLKHPGGFDGLSSYFSYFYGSGSSLLDYLPERFLIFLDEPDSVYNKASQIAKELEEHRSSMLLQGDLLPGQMEPLWPVKDLFSRVSSNLLFFSLLSGEGRVLNPSSEVNIEARSASLYHGQWELLKGDFQAWRKRGYHVLFLCADQERGKGLHKTLSENDIIASGPYTQLQQLNGSAPVQMVTASLENGFIIPSLGLAVVTEHNLVPRRRKKKRLVARDGIKLRDYRDLSGGDYVVHEHHGIGKYLGLSTLEVGGIQRDYLLVKYNGTDKLYIPADQIHLIQKYVGAEGKAPRLHSLGGGEWQRVKSKVSASVQEVARELLSLYAARRSAKGYAFGQDHPWQLEFEARFPYEETPDQLQCIREVKADMEKHHPMDRLICGDVGYGKTEVALRAAFKAAAEGKQVALLVPTTVLSQQHYLTFRERFADFPLNVAQLSRFVSPTKQKKVLADLARGRIDVIIGTHRLLSKDIVFHDLGLLIIDEEQRFGVRHKERLKQMRLDVDVLAMTATPIPRTLHLSLVGARDLSVIESPPENRYPVQTFVVEYSEQLIREAIQRELSRDGQVFFVFNRVEGIDAVAKRIQELFPGVTVAVGHGQMAEGALEQIMSDFLEGKYKILVSTTIIEAGLDIPNVNTLIVYDADRFGLSQLYQLRGRVGRSSRVAYAYLTYRKDKIISEPARKRLQAVKEFTELGSGFKIALRDLEIRGAGNILGAEQHGFMVAVGFDLYCRLLEQAVSEIKEDKKEKTAEPRLDLQVSAYLPASYITSQAQKIDFYQRIYTLTTEEELLEVEEELTDRYGSPPAPVKNLLSVALLRILAQVLGIELIQQQNHLVILQFGPNLTFDVQGLWPVLDSFKRKVTIAAGDNLSLKIKIDEDMSSFLARLPSFLKELVMLPADSKRAAPD